MTVVPEGSLQAPSDAPGSSGSESSLLETIGVIGLGQMGGRFAKRLVDHGYTVWGFDVDKAIVSAAEQAGVKQAGSIAALAAESSVILLSLPSPDAVRQVVLGSDGLVATGGFSCLIDHSTTGFETATEIGKVLTAHGVEVIDAPVSGGVRGAESGSLSIMVAGIKSVIEKRRALLETIGNRIFHVGDSPGQGQVMKLVNNMISSVAMLATSEGMVVGAKAGLDPQVMLDVLNASTGRNSHTEDKFPRFVLPRTFNFGFSMGLLYKDVRLGLDMARSLDIPMIVTANASQVWSMALAEGGPDQDMTAVVKYFEKWAKVELAGSPSLEEEEK